jgi:hypothetical protein
MAITSSQGVSIIYDDAGQGEPVLLFTPGWCANRTILNISLPSKSLLKPIAGFTWRG